MRTFVDHDLVDVFTKPDGKSKVVTTLFWGDELVFEPGADTPKFKRVKIDGGSGWVKATVKTRTKRLLKVSFIDVGQGDAAFVETPDEEKILIDAGQEVFLARYLAAKFKKKGKTLHLDAIVVTHGDADHFRGLPDLIFEKNLTVTADRVFHNGLVKRPSSVKDADAFGATVKQNGETYCVELVDDPRPASKAHGNQPFKEWADALDTLEQRKAFTAVKRLDAGVKDAFSFLKPGVKIDVLGPHTEVVNGKPGLKFLKERPGSKSLSASHTVNGHSVVLKVTHGKWSVLFTGDLNQEAEADLLEKKSKLKAEVLKVPHHGSADYGDAFLKAVSPLVSVVSTGATSAVNDHLHPRANLMAALGAAGRPPVKDDPKPAVPVVFVTRLAGALQYMGLCLQILNKKPKDGHWVVDSAHKSQKQFFGLQRASYGIVHVRCSEDRLLVVRRGFPGDEEPYVFVADDDGYHSAEPKLP